MKRFVGMFAALIILFTPIYAEAENMNWALEELEGKEKQEAVEETYIPVVTKHRNEESEEYIWNELNKYSPSEHITAGIMGYFWRESYMKSNAVAGWPHRNLGLEHDICETFTAEVDAGLEDGSSKDYFMEMVHLRYGGYGLGQWMALGYLEHFYEFVQEQEGSIGDAAIQCAFIFESLQQNEKLWELLLETENAERCGRQIGYMYDGTGSDGSNTIGCAAKLYYKRFHSEEESTSVHEG